MMKNNYTINSNILKQEEEIVNSINKCINENISFVFNAGAGAGKTYALVQALKYALTRFSKKFKSLNQEIRVITFTRAASNEIKKRIGMTDFIQSSTIHEFAWSIISNYPRELLRCHLEEVILEIQRKQDIIIPRFIDYLDEIGEEHFRQLVEKDNFYQLNGKKEIETFFNSSKEITNKTDFYKAAKAYVAKQKLEKTRKEISDYLNTSPTRIKKSFTIKYDHNSNIKNLNKLRIDHNLLLQYFSNMISKYPQIKSIIIDKFPILFIDEFQDTNDLVIKNIADIMQENINKYFVVGFFGDFFQNIYRTDNRLIEQLIDEEKLQVITKGINRRCSTQVIDLANKFNYKCKQKSAYLDHNDGIIQVINVKENLDCKLNELCKLYGKIDCLVLKNKLICEKIEILNIYNAFSSFNEYSNVKFENLNVELLSQDFDKLGKIQKIIYKLIKYYLMIKQEKIFLNDLSCGNQKISIKEIIDFKSKMYEKMENINNESTLNDFFIILFKSLENNSLSSKIKTYIFGFIETGDFNEVIKIFNENLTTKVGGDPYDLLASISFVEWKRWYDYVSQNDKGKAISYHTYHGTKGLEYENVAMVLDDSCGRKADDFKCYLQNLIEYSKTTDIKILDSDQNLRNLLYVAITRSYKNLFILNNTSIPIELIEIIFKV